MQKKTLRWLIQSVSGLLLTGTGLSMCIDAGLNKLSGEPWFWYGTAGLIVFQAGLSLVIDGVRFRK
ncbi:hypothetical protein OU792_10530 [Algoriphagus sp. NF]|jgi:hypothetical protein|uniref:Uncharacterized protein n=1 Tax=Algoriphagus formosus TaxID=2007308 RepID=A0A4V3AQN7_9BACT|nr:MULTISPECIES: hypothetical protein [Algoriphagus]MCR9083184.1 hypothetical protein [Cyclobacteriaceae bacterium]MDE0560423.1 hypothetical protein [Algoriphagus sp. NF]TDK43417.1 hypothetical protein E1898_12470 [Algoriphagus aquimaris]